MVKVSFSAVIMMINVGFGALLSRVNIFISLNTSKNSFHENGSSELTAQRFSTALRVLMSCKKERFENVFPESRYGDSTKLCIH